MKTHLPQGLRTALMAAIASVSLTSYAAATDVVVDGNYYGYQQTSGTLNLTFKPSGSFNRENVDRLYVLTASHTGDVNATVQQSLLGSQSKGYYLVGMGSKITLNGSLSLRTVATGSKATNRGNVLGLDYSDTVTGNVYMGLADNNTYSGWVYGVMNSTVQGTSKLEIAGGTFNGNVAVGYVNSWSDTNTVLNKGTELKITGGTFTNIVAAGSVIATNSPAAASINGGTNLTITNGTFSSTVYGGSTGSKSTIKDGITVTLSGGTFEDKGSVYALGSGGTVYGNVSLTIGNDATFKGNNVISAGSKGDAVNYLIGASVVTLQNIDSGSSLATNSTITVDGGKQDSKLVMDNVDTTIKARLSRFDTMTVTNGSDLTLDSTNANLGGVGSINVEGSSVLNLSGIRAENDLVMTVEYGSALNIMGGTVGDIAILGNATLSGNITIEGHVGNNGILSIASGTTLNIDEKTLAHNAHFVEGDQQTDNGFLAKESVRVARGGLFELGSGVKVTLDGETIADMALTQKEGKAGMELHVSGFDEKEANTYFVNKGDVTYSHIQEVAEQMGRTVNTIEVVSKLVSDVNIDNSLQNLMGDGTLSKTGTGTLSISGDASAFNGAVEVEAGTLEVGQSVTLSAAKGATIGANGVLHNDGVIGGELAVSGTLKGSGTMATTTIEEAGQLIVGNSPGKQTYTGDLTVKGAVDFSVDDLFGVPATAETSGWGDGTHSVIDMDGHSIFLNGNITLTLGPLAAIELNGEDIFELVLVQNIGNAEDYTVEKLTDLYSATAFRYMDGFVLSSSSPLLSQAHYEMKGNDLVLTNTPTTPEPATATLSLLALAALAARRKRK